MESETALVIVLLALCAILVWTVWYTVAHLTAANRCQAKLIDDAMLHLWSARTSETPERAMVAGQLEAMARPAPPMPRPMPAPQVWDDDNAMARS